MCFPLFLLIENALGIAAALEQTSGVIEKFANVLIHFPFFPAVRARNRQRGRSSLGKRIIMQAENVKIGLPNLTP